MSSRLLIISWPVAFDLFLYFLAYKPLRFVQGALGHFVDLETVMSLKDFFSDLVVLIWFMSITLLLFRFPFFFLVE